MIDQITIDRILDAAQIVDVVSEFVTLKKRGVNYVGLCPFHNEKTPSFSVSPAKGLCKCFSCGKGGNVVHFIMEHEQLNYYEALRFLAKKYNIEIQERELTDEEKQVQSLRESMFIVNQYASEYFQTTLANHPEGQNVGLAYLRQRGFRDDIIKKFQVGYCLEKNNLFCKTALDKGYKKELLVKTGLCYENSNNQLRDRFWGRVIFPVHTLSGKVVAFGGRVLSNQTKKVNMKYVNSPESEIYHKSKELYGIYFAKQSIVKENKCFLVEGYTDVISMHQSGVENVVASSGTALTVEQIKLIHRFTKNLTLLYDGDMAGIKASLRGIDLLLEEGLNIKVCLLPDGEDPDSFAQKHNSEEFKQFIENNEVDFIRFKTKLLIDDSKNDPIKKANLITDIVQSIAVIPEAIVRDVYIKECHQLMNIEQRLLVSEVAKNRNEFYLKKKKRENYEYKATAATEAKEETKTFIPEKGKEQLLFYKLERLILQVVIKYGEQEMVCVDEDDQEQTTSVVEYIINELKQDDLSFHNPIHNRILHEAGEHAHDENFKAERFFLSHPNEEISKITVDLITMPYQESKYHAKVKKIETEEERLNEIVPLLVTNFKYQIVNEELHHLRLALKKPEIYNDNEKCNEIMKRHNELKSVLNIMAKHLGDRVVLE